MRKESMKKTDSNNSLVISDHESGVRKIIANSLGKKYHSFKSLDEAKAFPNSVAIFEGDYGGQIYLTIMVKNILCSEDTLKSLLLEIDSLEWMEPESAFIFYEEGFIGQGIVGGMGGGKVVDGLWVHERLRGYQDQIFSVVNGDRSSILLK